MGKQRRKKIQCLNCGTKLNETVNFCSNCGQENHDRKVPLKFLLGDFARDYFTFDSKFFRSIVPLLIKPGYLTRKFNEGKRTDYILPIRMYIFISIVYFFALSLDSRETSSTNSSDLNMFSLSAGVPDVGATEVDTTEVVPDTTASDLSLSLDQDGKVTGEGMEQIIALVDEIGFEAALDSIGLEQGSFDRFLIGQMIKISLGQTNMTQMLRKNISIMMFFLMPFFALLLKWMFRKNKRYYIEHLIFAFHFHSFVFLFSTIFILFSLYIYDLPGIILVVVVLGYLYIALHNVYQRKALATIYKYLLLNITYLISITLAMLITVFITLSMV